MTHNRIPTPCPNPPADDHEHCPLHGCVEYVCCVPTEPWGRNLALVALADVAIMGAFAALMVTFTADADAPVWAFGSNVWAVWSELAATVQSVWASVVGLFVDPPVYVHPAQVSDAMNEALTAAGYDDFTVPVPRDVAIDACRTDTDCAVASGDPIGQWS